MASTRSLHTLLPRLAHVGALAGPRHEPPSPNASNFAIQVLRGIAQSAVLFVPAVLAERLQIWLSSVHRTDGTIYQSPSLHTALCVLASLVGIDILCVEAICNTIMGVLISKVTRDHQKGQPIPGPDNTPRNATYRPCRPSQFPFTEVELDALDSIVPSPPLSSGDATPPLVEDTSPFSSNSGSEASFCSRDVASETGSEAALRAHVPDPRTVVYAGVHYTTTGTLYRSNYVAVFAAQARCMESGRMKEVVLKVQRAAWPGETDDECEVFVRATQSGSPFLVTLKAGWANGEDTFFVMDRYPGTFTKVIRDRRIKAFERKIYAAELLLSLEALHTQRVIHGDIKPANILLSRRGHLALADYGLSIPGDLFFPTSRIRCFDAQGTLGYAAPETVSSSCTQMGWGVKADIWSYGVVVSELFAKNGELFFQCATEDTTKEATLFLPLAGLEELILDPLALEFVLFILHRDPDHRPMLKEIKRHPFFADVCWKSIAQQRYDLRHHVLHALRRAV